MNEAMGMFLGVIVLALTLPFLIPLYGRYMFWTEKIMRRRK